MSVDPRWLQGVRLQNQKNAGLAGAAEIAQAYGAQKVAAAPVVAGSSSNSGVSKTLNYLLYAAGAIAAVGVGSMVVSSLRKRNPRRRRRNAPPVGGWKKIDLWA